jgi:hypothetical protein
LQGIHGSLPSFCYCCPQHSGYNFTKLVRTQTIQQKKMKIKKEAVDSVAAPRAILPHSTGPPSSVTIGQPAYVTPLRTRENDDGEVAWGTPPSLADLKSNRVPSDPFWKAEEGFWNQKQAEELRYREDNLRLRVLLHKHRNDLLDIQRTPNHAVICSKVTETAEELDPACCVDDYFERIYNGEASMLQGIREVRTKPTRKLGTWNWDQAQQEEMRYREDNLLYRDMLHKHHEDMLEVQKDPSPGTISRLLNEAIEELVPKCHVDKYFEAVYSGDICILEGMGNL